MSIKPEQVADTHCPARLDEVFGVELDGESVLYHELAGTVHVLSATATVVWKCLDGSSDLFAISRDIAEVFAADVERVRVDVVAAVREFGRQGLLQGVQPDADTVASMRLRAAEGGNEPTDD